MNERSRKLLQRGSFLISLIVLSSILVFSSETTYESLHERFLIARSYENIQEIQRIIEILEKHIPAVENPHVFHFKVLLAESYLEAGNLAISDKEKKAFFEKSLLICEEILKIQPTNGKAYFISALATSQIIGFVNVFEKLRLLGSFDKYMEKALEYLQEDLYKGLAYMGLAVRYMSPPWPLNDYEKSEMYFIQAQKYIGDYSGLYLNWGYFYLKTNRKAKALEMFRKVLELKPNEFFVKAHERNVSAAMEEIKRLER